MIELTNDQRRQAVYEEMRFQLAILGQYLTKAKIQRNLSLLKEYSTIAEYERFIENFNYTEEDKING